MTKLSVIGVDLAKNVIQISVLSPSNRELRNTALTRRKFAEFLARQRRSLVAFEACASFGIGPKAYMKRQRLSAVRTDLLRSRPESLVTDVANRWGFWHMGQFANDYWNLFGELPSQTAGR